MPDPSTSDETIAVRDIKETQEDKLPYVEVRRWRYDKVTGDVIANRCPKCQQWLPMSDFNKGVRTKHGSATYCRPCHNQWAKEWNKSEVGKQSRHRSRIRYEYDLNAQTFDLLRQNQQGVCAICKQSPDNGKELCVDHCHVTGKVRGLLCDKCNRALGYLKEDPQLIRRAADYLDQSKENT